MNSPRNSFRFLALICAVLFAGLPCFGNWYNHPICTGNSILSWHSTYHDFNGTDFKSTDAPGGMIIPDANIRGITQRASVIIKNGKSTHTRGGSFPIFNDASRSAIRGYVNVLVQYQNNDTTVISYTFDFSTSWKYPTNTW